MPWICTSAAGAIYTEVSEVRDGRDGDRSHGMVQDGYDWGFP